MKNLPEQKLETETIVNKEEITTEMVGCAYCGKMFQPEIMRDGMPLKRGLICPECETKFAIPLRCALIALRNRHYVDRISKKNVKIILSPSVEFMYYHHNYPEFMDRVFWCLSYFLSYEWGNISPDEKSSNHKAVFNRGNEIIAKYESSFGDLIFIMDKSGTTLNIYFSDEYETSKYYFEH